MRLSALGRVVPAKAGTQFPDPRDARELDSRLRGNDAFSASLIP